MAALSAREVAYQKLHNRIITMELKPGDPLNDRLLAEEMGISRTPVREALIMLNIAHMVSIKPQSGTYVAPMDLKLMRLEQFARFTLEKEMLLQVYDHCQPAYIEAYQANIRAYEKAGFRREGVRRDAVRDGDRYGDDILMAILEDEWREVKAREAGLDG